MNELYFDIPAPAKIAANTLRVTPLGGLGEVGRNMTVFELNGRLLLVDCGVLFPQDYQPGVDLILPDLQIIEERLDDVDGLVITHGHEDHIGAVPYLLKMRSDIRIFGSRLTLALVESKIQEHKINANLQVVVEGDRLSCGEFSLEFCAVNHSIPDALAVFIRTLAGNVLVTGDFKMDQLPLDRRLTDLRAFARYGEEGVDLFMVDSTNAEVPGFVASERELTPAIESVFAGSKGKIVVASFSSHVHRVQQIMDAAAKFGRRVVLVGRSMVRNMQIAEEIGYLHIPDGVILDAADALELADEQLVYMCTGSQGEPMAALSRMARGEHQVKLQAGDTVLLASSLIPGNENSVSRIINQIIERGAQVVHRGNAKVHVSGHAAAGELLYCYNIVKPRNVLPIHGEIRHLVANAQLAVKTGVDPCRVLVIKDGVSVDIADGEAVISGAVDCDLVYVDGASVGEIGEDELRERRILAQEGFITVLAAVDLESATITSGPYIAQRGMAEDNLRLQEILPEVKQALLDGLTQNLTPYQLQQAMRRVVGRFAAKTLVRKPLIVPMVIETVGT